MTTGLGTISKALILYLKNSMMLDIMLDADRKTLYLCGLPKV